MNDHIWESFLKDKSDKAKLKMLRELRVGMTWGTQEHGIPQLSRTVVFLLKIIDEMDKGLVEEIIEYIKVMTVQLDGEYGSGRNFKEIESDDFSGYIPEVYYKLKEIVKARD